MIAIVLKILLLCLLSKFNSHSLISIFSQYSNLPDFPINTFVTVCSHHNPKQYTHCICLMCPLNVFFKCIGPPFYFFLAIICWRNWVCSLVELAIIWTFLGLLCSYWTCSPCSIFPANWCLGLEDWSDSGLFIYLASILQRWAVHFLSNHVKGHIKSGCLSVMSRLICQFSWRSAFKECY